MRLHIHVLKFVISLITPVAKYFFFPFLFLQWRFISLVVFSTMTLAIAQNVPQTLLWGQNERLRATEVHIEDLKYRQQSLENRLDLFNSRVNDRFEDQNGKIAELQTLAKTGGLVIGGLQVLLLGLSLKKYFTKGA